MPTSKRTIYKPKKGTRISKKKLYKLPKKQHGGDIFAELQRTFMGGEQDSNVTPDQMEVDDKKQENATAETPVEGDATAETPVEGDASATETPVEGDASATETPVEGDASAADAPAEEDASQVGTLQGIGNTMADSAGQMMKEITGPASPDADGDDGEVSTSPQGVESVEDSLRQKISDLQDKVIELQDQLIQERTINSSSVVEDQDMGQSEEMPSPSMDVDEMGQGEDMSPPSIDVDEMGEGEKMSSSMDVDEMGEGEEMASPSMNDQEMASPSMNDQEMASPSMNDDKTVPEDVSGGTKRSKKKKRKTRRKRNRKVRFV